MNRQISKEEVQMSNKDIFFTSFIIREMQIKTTLRFHLTPVRMAVIKKTTNVGEDAGRKGTLIHCWWECKLVHPL
jgi:hypothetical protein